MKWQSYLIHAFAFVIVGSMPFLMNGLPDTLQNLTVSAVLGLVFKWAHDYAGY